MGSCGGTGQAREHGAQAVTEVEDDPGLVGRRQRQDLDGLDGGSGLRGLAAGTAEASETILTLPAGCLGDAEIGGQQGAAELVAESGVAARQTPRDRVARAQSLPRDMECVEAVMVESPRRSLHDGVCRHETTSCCATKTWIIPITSEIEIDRSIEVWLMEV